MLNPTLYIYIAHLKSRKKKKMIRNEYKETRLIMFTNSKLANICLPPRISPNKISNEEFGSNGMYIIYIKHESLIKRTHKHEQR